MGDVAAPTLPNMLVLAPTLSGSQLEGMVCGVCFGSRKALIPHMRSKHRLSNLAFLLTLNNEC
eukprot:9018333-Pyramimonas_sp.AAC.1